MRTTNISTENNRYELKVRYPNSYTYSRTPYSYVRVEEQSGAIAGEVTLRLYQSEESGAMKNPLTLTRTFGLEDEKCAAVFPISELLEYYAGEQFTATNIYISVYVDGEWFLIGAVTGVLVGVSDKELVDFPTQIAGGATTLKAPFYPRIPIYIKGPAGCVTEIPTPEGQYNAKSLSVVGNIRPASFGPSTRFVHLGERLDNNIVRISYSYTVDGAAKTFNYDVPAVVEECANGLFVRWRDRHGLLQTFRWDVERIAEGYSTETSYNMAELSGNILQSRTTDVVVAKKNYLLHSGSLSREDAELPKSILTAREIEYYNDDLERWVPCRVADVEIEDDLAPMQEVSVELITEIDTMPW